MLCNCSLLIGHLIVANVYKQGTQITIIYIHKSVILIIILKLMFVLNYYYYYYVYILIKTNVSMDNYMKDNIN